MKVNMQAEFRNLDGTALEVDITIPELVSLFNEVLAELPSHRQEQMQRRIQGKGEPFTLKRAIFRLVGSGIDGFTPEELGQLYTIGARVRDEDDVDLKSEEISLLKKGFDKLYKAPLLIGQAREFLDPPAKADE